MIGGASEVGQQGDQELKLLLSAPFSSISLFFFLPVVMTSRRLLWLLAFSHSVASISFKFPLLPIALTQISICPHCHQVLAFNRMTCISLVFSLCVKLWNPLIETDYERSSLGFPSWKLSPARCSLGLFPGLAAKNGTINGVGLFQVLLPYFIAAEH